MYTTSDTPKNTELDAAPSGRESARLRRESAYSELRHMVLRGEFMFGQRLGEEAIAEQLNVSRTPVREALMRLHADHLVSRFPDGGFYLDMPNLVDLRDLYELRLALELRAITRAHDPSVTHDASTLSEIRNQWLAIKLSPPHPDGSFIELDESFHLELARASGNFALVETLHTINARIRAVRMYDFLTADRIETSINEHLAIVSAVIDGELDSAVELMSTHIGASLAVVEERAAAAMSQMVVGRSRRRASTDAQPLTAP
jgi:DNA-binding GntR family transcriptional regulator